MLCPPAPCQNPDCTSETRRRRPTFAAPLKAQRSRGRVRSLLDPDRATVDKWNTPQTQPTENVDDIIAELIGHDVPTTLTDEEREIFAGYVMYRIEHPRDRRL